MGLQPNSYFKNREEVNMACSLGVAYIIVKDSLDQNNEMKDPEEFADLRMDWEIASKKCTIHLLDGKVNSSNTKLLLKFANINVIRRHVFFL